MSRFVRNLYVAQCFLVLLSCSSESTKQEDNNNSANADPCQKGGQGAMPSPPTGGSMPQGGGPGGGGFGGGGGFYVQVPVTANSTSGSTGPTSVNIGGFRVECSTANAGIQGTVALALSIQRGSPQVTYTSQVSFQSYCKDQLKITVSSLTAADVATLKVTLSDPSGKAYSQGTTAAYTQGEITRPTFNPGDCSAKPSSMPTIPSQPEVKINMNKPT